VVFKICTEASHCLLSVENIVIISAQYKAQIKIITQNIDTSRSIFNVNATLFAIGKTNEPKNEIAVKMKSHRLSVVFDFSLTNRPMAFSRFLAEQLAALQ